MRTRINKEPTKKQLLEIFDYVDGKLYWADDSVLRPHFRSGGFVKDQIKRKKGKEAGTVLPTGHRQIRIAEYFFYTSRLIWVMHYGPIPRKLRILHKDRNPNNNHIDNLDVVPSFIAIAYARNQTELKKRSGSKYRGVGSRRSRLRPWEAAIGIDGERIYLGSFESEEDAARAYDEAVHNEYGKYAVLNFEKKA